MSDIEIELFTTALVFWFEHRQGGECADAADFQDGCEAVQEKSGVIPTALDKIAIRSLLRSKHHVDC